jgi:hypothetical protein
MTEHIDDRTNYGEYDKYAAMLTISASIDRLTRWVRAAVIGGFAIYALQAIHGWMW